MGANLGRQTEVRSRLRRTDRCKGPFRFARRTDGQRASPPPPKKGKKNGLFLQTLTLNYDPDRPL